MNKYHSITTACKKIIYTYKFVAVSCFEAAKHHQSTIYSTLRNPTHCYVRLYY